MKYLSLKRQRGMSLTSLIMLLMVLGIVGLLGAQVVPTFLEYRAISKAIEVAKAAGSSVRDIQMSFNKQCDVNYISAITGKDLEISKENGEFQISFEYQKKIHIGGPASLLLEYAGSTSPTAAKKTKE
jgi:type II secretory pathway pseudopilin PulG